MVVFFNRFVSLSPPVSFQLAYEICTTREDFDFVRREITFDLSDTREKLFVDVGIDEYASIVEEFGYAFSRSESMLVGSTVRSYLSWLRDSGRVEVLIEDSMVLWRRIG